MNRKQVTFEIEVPDSVPDKDLLAWLRFELGEVAELKARHPLLRELEAVYGTVEVRSVS